jgi:hypothetical protein
MQFVRDDGQHANSVIEIRLPFFRFANILHVRSLLRHSQDPDVGVRQVIGGTNRKTTIISLLFFSFFEGGDLRTWRQRAEWRVTRKIRSFIIIIICFVVAFCHVRETTTIQ